MALFATRKTLCRGYVFMPGEEITTMITAGDRRMMLVGFKAEERPDAPPPPPARTPHVRKPKTEGTYSTRRLKAKG